MFGPRAIRILRRPYQSSRSIEAPELERWQHRYNRLLPEDYKRFMMRWNGGAIVPFGVSVIGLDERLEADYVGIEVFDDWDDINRCDRPFRSDLPPEHIQIASEIYDEFLFLLCLGSNGYGSIRISIQSRHQNWDDRSDERKRLVTVASSFTELLNNVSKTFADDKLYHSVFSVESRDEECARKVLEF